MAELILETRKLSKEFKGFKAVDTVDLQVRQGRIHALIGPNGAGKTTCFNLLTHLLAPSAGQILFKGRDISRAPPARVARMGIVPSFQISAVFPHMSVLGVLAAAFPGCAMGALAIHMQGIYFAMITLALAQMVYFEALRAPFTHGEDGLQGVPRRTLFGVFELGNDLVLYYVVLAIAAAGFALIVRTVRSLFGQVLAAVRDTLVGLILGAFIVVALENKLGDLGNFLAEATHVEWFASLGESVGIVTGLIFVACVLLFLRGIVGELAHAYHRRRT